MNEVRNVGLIETVLPEFGEPTVEPMIPATAPTGDRGCTGAGGKRSISTVRLWEGSGSLLALFVFSDQ